MQDTNPCQRGSDFNKDWAKSGIVEQAEISEEAQLRTSNLVKMVTCQFASRDFFLPGGKGGQGDPLFKKKKKKALYAEKRPKNFQPQNPRKVAKPGKPRLTPRGRWSSRPILPPFPPGGGGGIQYCKKKTPQIFQGGDDQKRKILIWRPKNPLLALAFTGFVVRTGH